MTNVLSETGSQGIVFFSFNRNCQVLNAGYWILHSVTSSIKVKQNKGKITKSFLEMFKFGKLIGPVICDVSPRACP